MCIIYIHNALQARVQGKQVVVCQKAFAALHGVSVSAVHRISRASTTSTVAPKDMRGKHANRPKKITPTIHKQVKEHIKSFPVMKSHYSRQKNKRRRYLSPLLSVREMHRMYLANYETSSQASTVKYHYYSKIFNEEFNLSFGYPKSDTCGTCENFRNELSSLTEDSLQRREVEKKHDTHIHSAEHFYSSLRSDTKIAKDNNHVCTITFDFQQNLPLPHIPVGDIFYMHQLWVYVFGIHSCGSNDVAMYCWPETTAKRGSDEVISCLYHFLCQLPSCVTTLRLYSDGCGGQNKNANVMSFLFSLVSQGKFRHIRYTFPVTGHSFLPNDRDFGRTELAKRKNERVYTPTQWMEIIKGARKRKPFDVVPATQSLFLSFAIHFSPLFKKAIKSSKKASLNIQKA